MRKKIYKLFRNKYFLSGIVVLLIILCFAFRGSGAAVKIEIASAQIGNVDEKVSVTGKIMPVEKADLAFEKSGVVTKINFKVGDSVRKGDVIATLDDAGDRAAFDSAQAKLQDIERGLRPEELAVEQSKMNSAAVTLRNAKQDALDAVRSGLVETQTALYNYADNFFTYAQSANPTINVRVDSTTKQTAINSMRVLVSDTIRSWKADIDTSTPDSASTLISKSTGYISTVKDFMNQLSGIVNDLNPGNSGMTQATINADVALMNSAQNTLNQAISAVSTAGTALQNAISGDAEAQNTYILKNAGSSVQSIQAQAATVQSFKAELDKDKIVAPLDGIITKVVPHIGEFVQIGVNTFSVQSDALYKIEAYVPEADIAKVSLGNIASTTLDAYGQDVDFPTQVMSVDPAETVLEGVPTYKVTLQFINSDKRIRSGMTANLDILTHVRSSVLFVPNRAVIDNKGTKSVRLVNADGKTFRSIPVVTGLKGSDGTIEIISGLKIGDKVVTYTQ